MGATEQLFTKQTRFTHRGFMPVSYNNSIKIMMEENHEMIIDGSGSVRDHDVAHSVWMRGKYGHIRIGQHIRNQSGHRESAGSFQHGRGVDLLGGRGRMDDELRDGRDEPGD